MIEYLVAVSLLLTRPCQGKTNYYKDIKLYTESKRASNIFTATVYMLEYSEEFNDCKYENLYITISEISLPEQGTVPPLPSASLQRIQE